MKPDIECRNDIEKFVVTFYEHVKKDNTIGFIFTEVIKMNWEKHIPLIVDFWETILLDNPVYKNNAMDVHYMINKITPLKKEHFKRWVELFSISVDAYFTGNKATLAKKRAQSIAQVMLFKMESARSSGML